MIAKARLFLAVAVMGSASLLSACGSKQKSGPDSILVAGQRLQGQWRITAFTPEAALDPPLQGLLQAELGQMTVTFTGSNYRAVGPGMDINGRYQLQSAEGDFMNGTFYDQTGVPYRISGQFDGKLLRFHAYDSTWRGQGILERVN